MKKILLLLLVAGLVSKVAGQELPPDSVSSKRKSWTDAFSIRGYVQTRYNRLLETNGQLRCEQCDRSWGRNGGFFLRRARIILSGEVGPRVSFYFQPDFASSVSGGGGLNYGQLRDAYVDVALDAERAFRFRIGQSKLPYGFENMQSSSNRLPLDRADATNSAAVNERDIGLTFYYAPKAVRTLYRKLSQTGNKGSGDYGVFALGVYNGQGTNLTEQNDRPHVVGRLTYPLRVGEQVIEPGVQAYTGRYVVASRSAGVKGAPRFEYLDQRAAATFVLHPQPFGIQAEYNVGRGPEFNPQTEAIELRRLHGGYATLSYRWRLGGQQLFPFVRGQYYAGGKKFELDARRYRMRELEIGAEWQASANFELVVQYTVSRRRFEDFALPSNRQAGALLRVQAQLNY